MSEMKHAIRFHNISHPILHAGHPKRAAELRAPIVSHLQRKAQTQSAEGDLRAHEQPEEPNFLLNRIKKTVPF